MNDTSAPASTPRSRRRFCAAVCLRLTPIDRRRLDNFKANRRGYLVLLAVYG